MDFEALKPRFTQFSYFISAVFIVLLGINTVLGLGFAVREFQYRLRHQAEKAETNSPRKGQPAPAVKRTDYQMKWLDVRAYSPDESVKLDQVLVDHYDHQQHGFRFTPFVQYSNIPFRSPTLNILLNEGGFDYRLTPDSKPSAEKVFLFGGSTTFGLHVADEWTFANHLALLHPQAEVINFGIHNYSWFQELVLFQRLLHAGYRPKLALFMDGVNVFAENGAPMWSDQLQRLWEEAQILPEKRVYPDYIPMFRLINFINRQRRLAQYKTKMAQRAPAMASQLNFTRSYHNTIAQIRALGQKFGVSTLFVLQPNRALDCDNGQYGRDIDTPYKARIQSFYQEMRAYRASDFMDLSRLCIDFGPHRLAFVDDVHYSPQFNRLISERLAARLTKESISMSTSEKHEMRARRGGRAKSPQAYPKIRRGLIESTTKSGDADSVLQRKDTNGLLSISSPR